METWGLLLDTETVRQLTDERRAKLTGQWGFGGTVAARTGTARRGTGLWRRRSRHTAPAPAPAATASRPWYGRPANAAPTRSTHAAPAGQPC